jgi:hypothetical protein
MDAADLLSQGGRKSSELRLAAREGQQFDVLEGQKYPYNQAPIRDPTSDSPVGFVIAASLNEA